MSDLVKCIQSDDVEEAKLSTFTIKGFVINTIKNHENTCNWPISQCNVDFCAWGLKFFDNYSSILRGSM